MAAAASGPTKTGLQLNNLTVSDPLIHKVAPKVSKYLYKHYHEQRTAGWHARRRENPVTGSIAHRIINAARDGGDKLGKLVADTAEGVSIPDNVYMRHGRLTEPVALKRLEDVLVTHGVCKSVKILVFGLVESSETLGVAYSPDGVAILEHHDGAWETVLVEVKCPGTTGVKLGKVPEDHNSQMQLGMHVLGLGRAFYVRYGGWEAPEMWIKEVPQEKGWFDRHSSAFMDFVQRVRSHRERQLAKRKAIELAETTAVVVDSTCAALQTQTQTTLFADPLVDIGVADDDMLCSDGDAMLLLMPRVVAGHADRPLAVFLDVNIEAPRGAVRRPYVPPRNPQKRIPDAWVKARVVLLSASPDDAAAAPAAATATEAPSPVYGVNGRPAHNGACDEFCMTLE